MTIEELLEMPTDDIAKLSRAELEEWCRPFLPRTRPADLNPLPESSTKMDPEIEARMAELVAAKPSILSKLKPK